jgi:hypothetical protein
MPESEDGRTEDTAATSPGPTRAEEGATDGTEEVRAPTRTVPEAEDRATYGPISRLCETSGWDPPTLPRARRVWLRRVNSPATAPELLPEEPPDKTDA